VARVCFTRNLARHVSCSEADVSGATLRELLDRYFAGNPQARSYVLDEHGALRPHVAVFIDGAAASDRELLRDAVPPAAEVWVMQALSGGS
jgi:hypothetical protein